MKQHTPGVGHSIPHRVGGRRGRGPRDDLAFCLPISVSLAHSDWAGFVACSLHLFTLVIVLQALEGVPCLTTAIAVVISLLVCLRQQRRICGFNFLDCDQSGQWSLVDASGRHQWVRLDGLSVA